MTGELGHTSIINSAHNPGKESWDWARRYVIREESADARTFVLLALHRAQPLLGLPQ